jgi:hypothetical protein
MKLTIEPTSKVVMLNGTVDCRVWEGVDDEGIAVHCYIPRVAIPINAPEPVARRFRERLLETRPPSPEVRAIPLRLIL